MRVLSSFLLGLLLVLGATGAFASGGVLLPSCESGKCQSPNLGLGAPSQPVEQPKPEPEKSTTEKIIDKISNFLPNLGLGTSPKTATQAPQPATTQVTSSPPTTPKSPTTSGNNNITTSISPGGTVANGAEKESDLMRAMNAPRQTYANPKLRALQERQERLRNRPPVIINDIDPASYATSEVTKNYPNGITIGIAPEYMWGGSDVGQIKRLLGYGPKEIPSHCQLRLKGKAATDQGFYLTNVYAGQQSVLKYAGALQTLNFTADAACDAPQGELPASGKIIRQSGNKLIVSLKNAVTCNLPKKDITGIEITYGGDGAARCKFQ